MSGLRVTVLIALVIALASYIGWVIKMIREVRAAEARGGKFPFLLIFGGLFYFLSRHSQAVRNGASTRWILLLLILANVVLIGWFFVLGLK